MNNTLKNKLIAVSIATVAGCFMACSESATDPMNIGGVTTEPTGIADNDIESSSSMEVIIPGPESSSTDMVESSSSIVEISSSSADIIESSSSVMRYDPYSSSGTIIPVPGCKPSPYGSVKGASMGCVVTADVEWYYETPDFDGDLGEGGKWYETNDSIYGGDSKITWASVGEKPDPKLDFYGQVAMENRGLKGTAEIGAAYEYAYAAFGFSVGAPIEGQANKFQPIDASNWQNICISYNAPSSSFAIVLAVSDSLDTVIGGNVFKVSVGKSPLGGNACYDFRKQFKQETGWGKQITIEEALKNLTAIEFRFINTTSFFIKYIGLGIDR